MQTRINLSSCFETWLQMLRNHMSKKNSKSLWSVTNNFGSFFLKSKQTTLHLFLKSVALRGDDFNLNPLVNA